MIGKIILMYTIDYKVNELASPKKTYYNYYHEKWKSFPQPIWLDPYYFPVFQP